MEFRTMDYSVRCSAAGASFQAKITWKKWLYNCALCIFIHHGHILFLTIAIL